MPKSYGAFSNASRVKPIWGQRFVHWDSVERQLLAFHNTRFDVAVRAGNGRLEIQDELFVSQVKEITE